MAFSVSDLLNPAPSSVEEPVPVQRTVEDERRMSLPPASDIFAPELFQPAEDPSNLARQRTKSASVELFHDAQDRRASEVSRDNDYSAAMEGQYPLHLLETQNESAMTSQLMSDSALAAQEDGVDGNPDSPILNTSSARKSSTSTKPKNIDREGKPKPAKHSSKNEGQHTDKRYLCYICDKLFTRRRSVRDHIAKIHSVKTWEPQRSLEITVVPETGEPTETLEAVKARGPPPLPEKIMKGAILNEKNEGDDEQEQDQDRTMSNVAESVDNEPAPEVADEPAHEPELPSPAPVAKLKKESSEHERRPSSVEPMAAPASVIPKKRPPPSATTTKKGIAKSRPTPHKKIKLSEDDERSTPAKNRSPSITPASSQLKTPTSKLKKQTSAASVSPSLSASRAATEEPDAASPSASAVDSAYSADDDGEVYCICRRGDNHSWMIACDGGCDEWFHGKCVNIRERDGDLIDKYICPRCNAPGLQTTWKRMCRRRDCRKPARVLEDPPSKYCSKECGRMFFVELIRRGDPYITTEKHDQYVVDVKKAKKLKKKRRHVNESPKKSQIQALGRVNGDSMVDDESRLATPAYSEDEKSEYETDSSADENDLPNRGGALKAAELKAILEQCKTAESFRELGSRPVTPPEDNKTDFLKTLNFDDFDQAKLKDIQSRRRKLETQEAVLKARETFLDLAKTRSTSIAETIKKETPKVKDVCGYDPRLAWTDEEFSTWFAANGGDAALKAGKIGSPEETMDGGDVKMVDGAADEDEDAGEKASVRGGVCVKARCPRHRNWQKGQLAELRFEQDVVGRGLQRLSRLERGIWGKARRS